MDLLVGLLIFIVLAVISTPWFKGVVGEAKVKGVALLGLPGEIYKPFHNVTLPTPDGTTQVDHIFVSPYGIFVVETKNMSGWIFGGERQAQWTQVLFRKSYKFQSPLRQNYKHLKAVEAALRLPPRCIHSVVVFVGGCTFKSEMPDNVTQGFGFTRYVRSFREVTLSDAEVQEAVSRIEEIRLAPTGETHRLHVRQLNARSDPTVERKCPRCGGEMVLRTARSGKNSGGQFWGCSNYPKCKATQNLE